MNSADSFSADYPEARAKFLKAAADAGGALEAMAHPERGPDGGDLATDVAWFGPRDAAAVLVMISGTHGVEGFCGSGAQVDWLRRGGAGGLPPGVAVLMIHAVNPYGFAWLRRVTQPAVGPGARGGPRTAARRRRPPASRCWAATSPRTA